MEEKYYLQWMKKNQIESVLETNQYTCRFGLSLSEEDTEVLIKERFHNLKEQQRMCYGALWTRGFAAGHGETDRSIYFQRKQFGFL